MAAKAMPLAEGRSPRKSIVLAAGGGKPAGARVASGDRREDRSDYDQRRKDGGGETAAHGRRRESREGPARRLTPVFVASDLLTSRLQ